MPVALPSGPGLQAQREAQQAQNKTTHRQGQAMVKFGQED